jgi:U3 small nucleolar RNA-associated protein 3
MFKRDQIMFNPQDEASDEDIIDDGEEVMSIAKRQRPSPQEDELEAEEDEEMEDVAPKKRKEKTKTDVSGKGRFGKPVVDSDEEEEDEETGSSGSSSEEEEGWGRQYYSVPSTRREKEKEGEYDEKREEERELEEREVKRLQRKAREALKGEDYGLDDEEVDIPDEKRTVDDDEVVPVPETTDPKVLLKYMEVHEPVKLALAREWPMVVQKLEKTGKGMKALENDEDSQLHKGLGWLHYRKSSTETS